MFIATYILTGPTGVYSNICVFNEHTEAKSYIHKLMLEQLDNMECRNSEYDILSSQMDMDINSENYDDLISNMSYDDAELAIDILNEILDSTHIFEINQTTIGQSVTVQN